MQNNVSRNKLAAETEPDITYCADAFESGCSAVNCGMETLALFTLEKPICRLYLRRYSSSCATNSKSLICEVDYIKISAILYAFNL